MMNLLITMVYVWWCVGGVSDLRLTNDKIKCKSILGVGNAGEFRFYGGSNVWNYGISNFIAFRGTVCTVEWGVSRFDCCMVHNLRHVIYNICALATNLSCWKALNLCNNLCNLTTDAGWVVWRGLLTSSLKHRVCPGSSVIPIPRGWSPEVALNYVHVVKLGLWINNDINDLWTGRFKYSRFLVIKE